MSEYNFEHREKMDIIGVNTDFFGRKTIVTTGVPHHDWNTDGVVHTDVKTMVRNEGKPELIKIPFYVRKKIK